MAKKTTVAALALVSVKNNKIFVSTKGSEVAPGSKWKGWLIKWGDNEEIGGNAKPTENIEHDYPILEPEPGLTEDSYDIFYEIKDSKGGTSQAVVDNVIITRNPTNPPPIGLVITNVTPNSADVGALITITGYGFGVTQGTSTVTFDGTLATISSWTDTLIKCLVPNIGTGTAVIVVTVNVQTGQAAFNVTGTPATFDFYVSKSGNNSWNGLFPDNSTGGNNGPKLTVAAGMALLSAGKSLGIGTGDYDENFDNPNLASGTSWSNKVRIAAMPGATVWLKPSGGQRLIAFHADYHYIEFDGINLDGRLMPFGTYVMGFSDNSPLPHHIRLANCTVLDNPNGDGAAGTLALGAHVNQGTQGGHEVINVTVTGGCGYCIYMQGPNMFATKCNLFANKGVAVIQIYNAGGDAPDNCVITKCRCHDFTQTKFFGNPDSRFNGVIIDGNNALVAFCEFYNNDITAFCNANGLTPNSNNCGGPLIAQNRTGCRLLFNTVVKNNMRGILVDSGSNNNTTQNNIAYQNTGLAYENRGTNNPENHNSFLGVNPQFANLAGNDFHLTAATPASIKTGGISISGFNSDIDDVPLADPPSIGAHQFV